MNDDVKRIEIKTENGVRISHPETVRVPPEWMDAVEEAVRAIESATGREVFAVYVNADREEPSKPYDFKFVFRKRF